MANPEREDDIATLLRQMPRLKPDAKLWQRIAADTPLRPAAFDPHGAPPVAQAAARPFKTRARWIESLPALAAALVLMGLGAALALLPWATSPASLKTQAAIGSKTKASAAGGARFGQALAKAVSVNASEEQPVDDVTLSWLATLGELDAANTYALGDD